VDLSHSVLAERANVTAGEDGVVQAALMVLWGGATLRKTENQKLRNIDVQELQRTCCARRRANMVLPVPGGP
jgi:hypothetical protein